MPSFVYDKVLLPEEAAEKSKTLKKAVRISYWKMFGEEPPGWLIGVGRMEGNKFVVEQEFVAQELIVKTQTFGYIAFQKPEHGDLIDRGWILTFSDRVEFDGKKCVIL